MLKLSLSGCEIFAVSALEMEQPGIEGEPLTPGQRGRGSPPGGKVQTEATKSGGGSPPVLPKSAQSPQQEQATAAPSARRSLSQGSVSYERLRSLKVMVDRAIKEHRVFSVAGPFPTIRQALKQRGWLEKTGSSAALVSSRRKRSSMASKNDDDEEEPDPLLVSRLLRNCTPDLLWALRSDAVDWRGLARWQLVNRFPKALFTTKVGLSGALQHMQWFTEEGVSETLFPRSYCVSQPDEMVGFVTDFRLTACYSLLRHVTHTLSPRPKISAEGELTESPAAALPEEKKPEDKEPESARCKLWVPTKAMQFALSRVTEHVRHLRHEDVDDWGPCPGGPSTGPTYPPGTESRVWDCEWDQFLTYYYQVVHDGAMVAWDGQQQKEELLTRSNDALSQYVQLRSFSDHDGTLNLWIVKPGARSCGRGIHLMDRLEHILTRTQPGLGKESRFVVQKYIERPLLIYNTKFDIRQWFLVTSAQPLTIWMYRESYLRFCSQTFDLTNLHESVHLSNNAVQCRYQNGRRDPALPDENMWDCYTFQTYLRSIGRAEAWEEVIYPGMRAGIIGAMLASQDWLDSQRNCFELYGADFLLSEGDLQPWLLEVNCSPCMAPSTSVTARMCAQCLEDVLRVVVDRRDDREASTGMFELVYRQHTPPAPPYQGVSLGVKGRRLTAAKPRRHRHKHRKQRGPKAGGASRDSSSCSSMCSECSTEEEDENRLNLAGQHRVTIASPLKVVKAEINVPPKQQKKTSPSTQQIILPPNQQTTPPPLVASDLRVRLEQLLQAETAKDKIKFIPNLSSNPYPSRSRSAHTNRSSSPPPPVKPASPAKTKKNKKPGNSKRFKVSGKNIMVVQRDGKMLGKPSSQDKINKTAADAKRDANNNGKTKSPGKGRKGQSGDLGRSKSCENSETQDIEADNQNIEDEQRNNDFEINSNMIQEENVKNQNLLLQPDNLRNAKKFYHFENVLDVDSINEEDCFKDPGKSLAIVKEWRRRLEATRASCEHMLAQLKAFRDPVKPSKSAQSLISNNPAFNLPPSQLAPA